MDLKIVAVRPLEDGDGQQGGTGAAVDERPMPTVRAFRVALASLAKSPGLSTSSQNLGRC